MLAHFLPALCASVLAAGGCQQDNPAGIRARPQTEVAPAQDTTLVPIADTYLRQGSPNQNQGAELILRLQSSGKNRVLLRWDQQALTQAVAGGTLAAARLELTIADLGDNWSAAGRTVDLHRLTHAWTELGATWNCAVDSVPGNSRAECAGATAWDMDHSASYPWFAPPTATALLRNNQTGVVAFDVTTDVQAWLAGQQPNYGWILKKTGEGDPGKVDFGSRESGAGPRLVLRIKSTADTTRPPVPESMDFPDDSLHTVEDTTNPGDILYRTLAEVVFDDSVSGITIRAFLRKYQAVVVGGTSVYVGYILQFPDPGSTLDAFRALLRRMGQEPGVFAVLTVGRSSRPPEPDGRYPADGPNLGRAAWFDPNSAYTWAGLAIRAPLAWGCENGLYGSAGPPVGVVELRSGQLHDDLSASVVVGYVPQPFGKTLPAPETTLVGDVRHANAVAGLIGAAGDNGKGAAGMVWGGRLRLYALEPAGRLLPWQAVNRVFQTKILPRLAADGVRIVNLSVASGGPPADSAAQRVLLRELSRFLRANPRVLVVKSTGNKRLVFDVDSLLRVRTDNGLGLLAALARLKRDSAAFRDRILLVSGTQRGGALWDDPSHGQGANFVRGGVTEIAAPAAQVATLDHPGQGEDAILQNGTSFSAALVSGVAAQLLAMDSTLTAAEVKDYILRGDSAPRLSSTTGDTVPAVKVSGAPETIYQLDAYGALTLLSRERPGTPICGYPVRLGDDWISVTLEPQGRPSRTLPVPGAHTILGLSIAQGGRLIAVFDNSWETGRQTILIDHGGRLVRPALVGVERRFLERDTVDIALAPSPGVQLPVFTILRGDGTGPRTFDPFHDLLADTLELGFGDIAPSGDVAALVVARRVEVLPTSPCSIVEAVRRYFVPLSAPALRPLGEERYVSDDCPPSPFREYGATSVAWSHDGRRAVFLTTKARIDWNTGELDPFQTTITRAEAIGSSDEGTVTGLFIDAPRFSADDSLVAVGQADVDENCQVALRSADAPWSVVGVPTPGRPYVDCSVYVAPAVPNAPIVRGLASSAGERGGSGLRRASGGFALLRAAQVLDEGVAAGRWRRSLPRRVQVN